MWKDKYATGIALIDTQHQELFRRTQELLQSIEANADKGQYRQLITFLKDYVVVHFRDEERYQQEIGYADFEAHRAAHQKFIAVVLEHEKQLIESDFALSAVKDLAGTLTSWLIYHVVYMDLHIADGAGKTAEKSDLSHLQTIKSGVLETLDIVASLSPDQAREYDTLGNTFGGDVFISVGLTGDINGRVSLEFTQELAFQLIERMIQMRPETIDELTCSALAEISNISLGNSACKLSAQGCACDITPPLVSLEKPAESHGGIILDYGQGALKVSATLDTY